MPAPIRIIEDGTGAVITVSNVVYQPVYDPAILSRRVDTVTDDLMYVGEAPSGASESDAVWRIKRITFSGDDITIVWPQGNASFAFIWANRAALVYA